MSENSSKEFIRCSICNKVVPKQQYCPKCGKLLIKNYKGPTSTAKLLDDVKNIEELVEKEENTTEQLENLGDKIRIIENSRKKALKEEKNVPSLIAPWTTASMIYCTDCHNNNEGPGAGGAGPAGPHGSQFTPLLERQLDLFDQNPESAASYALCYKCHSRSSILADQSFAAHQKHIVDQKTPAQRAMIRTASTDKRGDALFAKSRSGCLAVIPTICIQDVGLRSRPSGPPPSRAHDRCSRCR